MYIATNDAAQLLRITPDAVRQMTKRKQLTVKAKLLSVAWCDGQRRLMYVNLYDVKDVRKLCKK